MDSKIRWATMLCISLVAAVAFTACSTASASAPSDTPTIEAGSAPTSAPDETQEPASAPTMIATAVPTSAATGAATSAPAGGPTSLPATSVPTTEPTTASSGAGTPGANAVFPLKAATNSALGQILVDARGMTLYINKNDTSSTSACTGSCANTWPPLTVSGSVQAALDPGVTGQLGTLQRSDGSMQVTLNGMPLYWYSTDANPGDDGGQGVSGIWSVVVLGGAATPGSGTTPAAPAAATSAP